MTDLAEPLQTASHKQISEIPPFFDRSPITQFDAIIDSVRSQYLDSSQQCPWIIGFSGGKDSTVVLQAVFEAVLGVSPKYRTRNIHVVSNNTLVESPLVVDHVRKVFVLVRQASEELSLPISVVETKPELEQSFWVLLIGKGYPHFVIHKSREPEVHVST